MRPVSSRKEPPFSIRVLDPPGSADPHNSPTTTCPSGNNVSRTQTLPHSPTTAPTTQSNISSTAVQDIDAPFPASFRMKDDNLAVPRPDEIFLTQELGVQRLNRIHESLWLAGRPRPPRALHHQNMLGREIVVTEQMDMHLVWLRSRMFIKPMPRFLLTPSFWQKHLGCAPGCKHTDQQQKTESCKKKYLWDCALGYLLSYAALIGHESDYRIARELHLLPKEVSWDAWRVLVEQLLADRDIYHHINQRFLYGELRLGRLNMIHRFTGISPLQGYMNGYSTYADFFHVNLNWLASIFGYVVIVLTAMQVGLATSLQKNASFQSASYGFTVFSIVSPLIALIVVLVIFCILFVNNWIATKDYGRERFHKMGIPPQTHEKPESAV